jgi:hypothetical protein
MRAPKNKSLRSRNVKEPTAVWSPITLFFLTMTGDISSQSMVNINVIQGIIITREQTESSLAGLQK